ncbi:M16 family metallopeptidase [Rubeoparvulum massiliense]|uniref:M16 family metallopeptidase n=1 Tax=Rubeoparvulum massiliense TaxID=1631346 RepID=UPI00065DBEA9|nr:insulinase family protein [Rubeoparvulum massiliense]
MGSLQYQYLSSQVPHVYWKEDEGIELPKCFIFFAIGTRDEQRDEAGISHFIEHLLLQTDQEGIPLEQYLLQQGCLFEARTTRDYTIFLFKGEVDALKRGLSAFFKGLQNFPNHVHHFEEERKSIQEEMMTRFKQPQWIFSEQAFQAAWHGHSLANSILGSQAQLQQLSMEKIASFFRREYGNGKMALSSYGIDTAWLEELISGWQSDEDKGDQVDQSEGFRLTPQRIITPHDRFGLTLAFPTMIGTRQDIERINLSLLTILLGADPYQSFIHPFRQQGLVYEHFTYCQFHRQEATVLINMLFSQQEAPLVLHMLYRQLKQIAGTVFAQQDLTRAQLFLREHIASQKKELERILFQEGEKLLFRQTVDAPTLEEVIQLTMKSNVEQLSANFSTLIKHTGISAFGSWSDDDLAALQMVGEGSVCR